MKAGIDISNLQAGGGLSYALELLGAADPGASGIDQVTVWSNVAQRPLLPQRLWLINSLIPALARNRARRFCTQIFSTSHHHGHDVVFAPGGIQMAGRVPVVFMAHNMLPFDAPARRLCTSVVVRARLGALGRLQGATLRRSSGAVFLSQYAATTIQNVAGRSPGPTVVIPHGISPRFTQLASMRSVTQPLDRPFRWLYVSPVTFYKHHLELITAASALRSEGLNFELRLVGAVAPASRRRFEDALREADPQGLFIQHAGKSSAADVPNHCAWADGFVFPSSCENLPLTLLEALASGLSVVSSSMSGMTAVAGDGAIFMNPFDPSSIRDAMRRVMMEPELRAKLSRCGVAHVAGLSWAAAARRTFDFLSEIGRSAQANR